MSKIPKIQVTRNYRLFERSINNRLVTPEEHALLRESLQEYGFLPYLPIICIRDEGTGKRFVKDGQNRLVLAEELGLPVFFVDCDPSHDFDVAKLARTGKAWKVRDFAAMHAANGIPAYVDGLKFAEENNLPVGLAFAMLGGCTNYSLISPAFIAGEFKIKDRAWANLVAATYLALVRINSKVKGVRFLLSVSSVCRVPEFSRGRLLAGAERQRDKLVPYATGDAYLSLLECLYNYGQSKANKFPLKIEAQRIAAERGHRGAGE